MKVWNNKNKKIKIMLQNMEDKLNSPKNVD